MDIYRGKEGLSDYILIIYWMREKIYYMKIEDVINSDHFPLVVSRKADRDMRRRDGREGKGICRRV